MSKSKGMYTPRPFDHFVGDYREKTSYLSSSCACSTPSGRTSHSIRRSCSSEPDRTFLPTRASRRTMSSSPKQCVGRQVDASCPGKSEHYVVRRSLGRLRLIRQSHP